MSSEVPDSTDDNEQFDSAGQTWRGRQVTDTGFGHDDGSASPAVLQALSAPGDEVSLMATLADARFLVPIVADATEVVQGGGLHADKAADMAVAVLVGQDGTRALPVFTSLDSLHAWDPAARPSPVAADKAAQAAVSERADVMVVDLAGPHQAVLRPSMVWALAMGRPWRPAHEDEHVIAAVDSAVALDQAAAGASCEAGESGALRIVLHLRPGLDASEVSALAQRVGERLATDGEVRARIDAVSFAVRPAE